MLLNKESFLIYCPSCKHSHRMAMYMCSECRVYEVLMPISEEVYNKCKYLHYRCDGCEAYNERYR